MHQKLCLPAALSLGLFAQMLGGCTLLELRQTRSPSGSAVSSSVQGQQSSELDPSATVAAVSAVNTPASFAVAPENPQPASNAVVQQYLSQLASRGFGQTNQGIWMQSGDRLLANHQGTVPLPAASLTKVATSLVALETWGPDHQFVTLVSGTQPVKNGVLQGDLVIQGSEDPFFVWEDAIAVGNLLNQLGIKRVTGNLIITGKFYMNYEMSPVTAGNLLKQGLNTEIWPGEAETQYLTLPPGTPRPQVVIEGVVQAAASAPSNAQPLVQHNSLPLAEILKKMNLYSNNLMAEMLADSVGGARAVAQKAALSAKVPVAEIQLINGSGLGVDNRISPRAVCAMFLAMQNYLQPYNLTVADVFAVTGRDVGILSGRLIPPFSVVKTGTLDSVSALAGAMPTQQEEAVWFAIINGGEDIEGFRNQQDALLKRLLGQWGSVQTSPTELAPNPGRQGKAAGSQKLS